MRRTGSLLLACLLLLLAGCSTAPQTTDTAGYETAFPAQAVLTPEVLAADSSAALTGSYTRLQRYEIVQPQLTQAEMETVMAQTAQHAGVSFIDTEEQWEDGCVVGTRALCSNGLVIRVWSDGTMQLIWPDTLSPALPASGDALADAEALYRAYYDAYAGYLQFSDPVLRWDAAGDDQSSPTMVILDGAPTEEQPFPASARFIAGNDEQGDRLEVRFLPGQCKPLGQLPVCSREEAAAQLSDPSQAAAACLTYGKIPGTDTYEPVYVFHIPDPASGVFRTSIVSAVAAP